jgi:hypothetical protein
MNRCFGIHPLLGPAIIFNAVFIMPNQLRIEQHPGAGAAYVRNTQRQAP